MNFDCTTPKYGELYARWLVHPAELLDLVEMPVDGRVLDLCGGTGILSQAAIERGALHVTLLDLAPRAEHLTHLSHWRVRAGGSELWQAVKQVTGRAEDAERLLPHSYYDLVVCRQSIGYLDMKQTAKAISTVLRNGGQFVFNAFVKPRWALKSYRLNGTRFFEASAYAGSTVFHLQAGLGIGIDVTRFRWHREDVLDAALAPYFKVKKNISDRSLYYVCTKRG